MGTSSPFKPPNDEEVFVTRETEKLKKLEAKEKAKHLKIWEKNTATSRAPLRRVKDKDIRPAENEEQFFNFNSYINTKKVLIFYDTCNIHTPKRKDCGYPGLLFVIAFQKS